MEKRYSRLRRGALVGVGLVAIVLICSSAALAQSAIAGVVKDATGSVLPGVTVEAASPSLIERVRTVVTDAQGQYKIVDLRPGPYDVTFSLAGFATVKQAGIQLPANFTASVNADLKVGAIEETVTVSGVTPIVDVQSAQSQNVLTRELLDALPTPRNFQAVAITTPGVTISRPDVGGSEGYQITNLTVHGSETRDMSVQIDGLAATTVNGNGSNTAVYHNDLAYEEMSYQTSAISAESLAGGVRVSMVPRDGGNTFKGAAFAGYAPGSLQSDNFSDELRARGLRAVPNVQRIFDYNVAFGGPIQRDRLWFFATGRYWGVDQAVTDSFDVNGKQGVNDNLLKNAGIRLTAQATPRNKIALNYETTPKWMGHHGFGSGVEPSLATRTQKTPESFRALAKWTSPLTSKLFVEAGGTQLQYIATYLDHPGVGDNISKVDVIAVTTRDAPPFQQKFVIHTIRANAAVTYVTGSHAFKAGLQYGTGYMGTDTWIHGDLIQQYRNGVPDAVQVKNTPTYQMVRMNNETALYAQDVWTITRLTLSAGLRFDHIDESVDPQSAPAGRFVPARSFAEVPNVPHWNDLSPRFGASYDLFGNGRTAIKVSASKYPQNNATGYPSIYNPMISDTDVRTWSDLNRDNIAQDNEIGPSQNRNFGIRQNRFPAGDISRPYEIEYTARVERQLGSSASVSGGYFRRGYHRLIKSTNLAAGLSDYTPITIANPLGGESVAVYSLSPSKLGLVNILDSTSSENSRTYNGFEASLDVRVTKRLRAFGGITIDRTRSILCDVQDDPNQLRYCDQTQYSIPFRQQYKLSGSYILPLDIRTSGVLQSYPGGSLGVNYLVNRAIAPGLTQSQVSVPIAVPGSRYGDRLTQVDARLSKIVRVGHLEVEGAFDIFNALNSSAAFNEVQTYGSSLGRPTDVIQGRIFRFGAQMKF
jgi:Carboxypeptidase regulatory-like domain